MDDRQARARAYAALGDPSRLAIVDLLAHSDLAPGELGAQLGMPTNLMSHHLQILHEAGLVARRRSEGDGRRAYVVRTAACNRLVGAPDRLPRPKRVAFICSQNSARSQLAESYWRTVSDVPATSAGTRPAERVHPEAVRVGRRHDLDLSGAAPRSVRDVLTGEDLPIAVCDRAYEELRTTPLHWAVPDPALSDDPSAFERAFDELTNRIDLLAAALSAPRAG